MKDNIELDWMSLPGPARLRAMFFPKFKLKLSEVAPVLGLTYLQLHKRLKARTIDINVRDEPGGTRFVLVDDLIAYLYPDPLAPSWRQEPKKGPGRPRKEGGAR